MVINGMFIGRRILLPSEVDFNYQLIIIYVLNFPKYFKKYDDNETIGTV